MSFWKNLAGKIAKRRERMRGGIVWDVSQGGMGPVVRNGVFSIRKRGLFGFLTTAILLNVTAIAEARAAEPPAPLDPAGPRDMVTPALTNGPFVVADNCVHHDSHNDKIMESLGGSHLDQHGDLSC